LSIPISRRSSMFSNQKEVSGLGVTPETTLFAQAQAGCTESLNELMGRNEGLVHLVVRRQWLLTLEYEEALQAGRRGLWRAVLGYKPEHGTRFSTYAYPAIMKHIWGAVKSEQRRMKREVPIAVVALYSYETGPDPAWLKERDEIRNSLLELVKRLPEQQQEVITAYYGLGEQEPQTLQAIGKQFGISQGKVWRVRKEALVWLSQPGHSQALRSLAARHSLTQYELADQLAQAWLKRRGGRHGHI
jgi:RNA polymerase sigma factor (sigma-70 family)